MIVLAGFILFMGSSIFEHKRISLGVKLFFLFLLHQHHIFLRKRLLNSYSLIPVDLRVIISHINILLIGNIMPNMLAKTPTKYRYVD